MNESSSEFIQAESVLPTLLLRARLTLLQDLKRILQSEGLTEQQWRIIEALSLQPGSSASELAKLTGLLGPSVSLLLRKMENEQLIQRLDSDHDQRVRKLFLTKTGHLKQKRVSGLISSCFYPIVANKLRNHEIQHLLRLLNKITTSTY
jgi:DNA-binding MarR family transcriptional regulator